MSGRDLERFFIEIQSDYLNDYSDDELLEELQNHLDDETVDSFLSDNETL